MDLVSIQLAFDESSDSLFLLVRPHKIAGLPCVTLKVHSGKAIDTSVGASQGLHSNCRTAGSGSVMVL